MDLLQGLVRGLVALGWLQSVSTRSHRDSVPCLGSECSCSEQHSAPTVHETLISSHCVGKKLHVLLMTKKGVSLKSSNMAACVCACEHKCKECFKVIVFGEERDSHRQC